MVHQGGLEPPTYRLEGGCSIRLSYWCTKTALVFGKGTAPGTWARYLPSCGLGAGDGIRTRDIQLGRLSLYQLSYSRTLPTDGAEPRPTLHSRATPTRGHVRSVGASSVLVGAAGFEPATPCSQSRCATRLRYAPSSPPRRRHAILTGLGPSRQRRAHRSDANATSAAGRSIPGRHGIHNRRRRSGTSLSPAPIGPQDNSLVASRTHASISSVSPSASASSGPYQPSPSSFPSRRPSYGSTGRAK